ncbi:prepilin-type N-terminal cleavage/methylation domain-containing protein [Thalassotalea euphylliae]|uniref:Prepilin-type N-terminal cleavage/methylation domain-containing protein n=1 Tax=Thalassotalea euphylliae TaxID=1655234 RepID=A0A3E0TV23_9GAMM|nr:prepilin-type N-terminal cleavage/methylation domain-containing protein [Thalassotalea euphylliae]REL28526.1 prepilin-type N-terminal cleavage/methylation domain-containing protein [Thalassotalea euphylliae]
MGSRPHNGFTLIELIIVIVILGIVAATAVPRLIDLTEDANLAAVRTFAANFEKAANDAHLRWQIAGAPGRIQNMPGFGDGTLDMSTNGWPLGTNKGNANDNVGRGSAGCHALWNYLLVDGPRADADTSQDFQSYRHSGNTSCSFVYRANGDTAARSAAKLGVLYNSISGSVSACGTQTATSC